ncbi:MAG: LysR family transcriptional regulator [Eggerthellaceae bacterium]
MNLSQLYYFRKLAELQHYTRAAKELFITQPTLSGSISSLEQELGVSLFQKAGRNVELTKYGSEFLEYVNAALEQLDKGIAIMKGYSGEGDGGTIDLGCIITLQSDFLPRLLQDYVAASDHETVFDINQKPSQELIAGVIEGKHDIAFCACEGNETGIEKIPVAEQLLVVSMSPSSPLASKPFLTPADLEGQKLISYREEVPLGASVKRLLDSYDVTDVRYSYEDESILAGLAATGMGYAVMLDTFFPHTIDDIVIKPLFNNAEEQRRFSHMVYLIYSDKNYRPYCVDHFIDYVREHKLDLTATDHIYID